MLCPAREYDDMLVQHLRMLPSLQQTLHQWIPNLWQGTLHRTCYLVTSGCKPLGGRCRCGTAIVEQRSDKALLARLRASTHGRQVNPKQISTYSSNKKCCLPLHFLPCTPRQLNPSCKGVRPGSVST
jgi:hypothetical protein